LSQSPHRQQKNRNLQSPGIAGAFAYSHLSGALLVARNASAMSPIGPKLPIRDVRYTVAFGGKADVAQPTDFGSD
jgi:hypothetical protein